MAKGKGRTTGPKLSTGDDLSLEDLDRVVGGAATLNPNQEQQNQEPPNTSHETTAAAATSESPPPVQQTESGYQWPTEGGNREGGSHEGGYVPPPPPPPPAPDADVDNVTNHLGTGHDATHLASVQILDLIHTGQARPEDAMASIHASVASHALTGEQAIEIIGGLSTDPNVRYAAYNEIKALVDGHVVTADHALTSLARTGNDVNSMNEMTNLAGQMVDIARLYNTSPSQLVSNIHDAIVSHDLTGGHAIQVLMSVSQYHDTQHTLPLAGAELGRLVAAGEFTPAQVMAEIGTAIDTMVTASAYAVPFLSAAVEANPALEIAAGQQIAAMVLTGHVSPEYGVRWLSDAVNAHIVSPEHAVGMLAGILTPGGADPAAQNYQALVGFAHTQLVSWIDHGLITAPQAVAEIHHNVVSGALHGDQGLTLYASFLGDANAALVNAAQHEIPALISGGFVTLSDAVAQIHGAVTSNAMNPANAVAALLGIAAFGTADMKSAATDALVALAGTQQLPPVSLGYVLAHQLSLGDAAFQAAATEQISALVSRHVLTADEAVQRLAYEGTWGATAAQQQAVCTAIHTLIREGLMSPAQAMADIANGVIYKATAVPLFATLASLSGGDYAAVAGAQIGAMIDSSFTPYWAMQAFNDLLTAHMVTADQAVQLLAATGCSQYPGAAAAIGAQIATIMANGGVSADRAVAAIHGAITAQALPVDQALVLLTYVCKSAGAAAREAIHTELAALVASQLVTVDHATDVLRALAAADTSVQAVVGGEISALTGANPVQMVLNDLLVGQIDAPHIADAASRIDTLITQGRMTADAAMREIHAAVTSHQLTGDQAISLLASVATAGNAAIRSAAGVEVGALLTGGLVTQQQVQTDLRALLYAQGGNVDGWNGTQRAIVEMMAGILNNSASSADLRSQTFGILRFVPGTTATADILGDMAVARTMAGHTVIDLLVDMAGGQQSNALNAVIHLLNVQKLGMSDVHAAVQAGEWSAHEAVIALARLTGANAPSQGAHQGAALQEIVALVNAGLISGEAALSDIASARSQAMLNTQPAYYLGNDSAFLVMGALAGTSAAMLQRVSDSMVEMVNTNAIDTYTFGLQLHAVIASRAISGDASINLLMNVANGLGAVMRNAVGSEFATLVTSGQVTLDHLMSVVTHAPNAGLVAIEAIGGAMASIFAGRPADAIAAIHSAVGSQALDAGSAITVLSALASRCDTAMQLAAGYEVSALVTSGAISASDAIQRYYNATADGALGGGQAVNMLAAMGTSSDEALRNMARVQILTLIESYPQRISAAAAVDLLARLCADGNAALLSVAGENIATIAANPSRLTPFVAVEVVHRVLGNGPEAFGVLTTMMMNGTADLRVLVSSDFTARVASGDASADAVVSGLITAMGSHLASHPLADAAGLQASIAAQIMTFVAGGRMTAAQAVGDIHAAAVTAHSITGEQATGLLLQLMTSRRTDILPAAAAEFASLIAANVTTIGAVMTAVDRTIGANFPILLSLAGASPGFEVAVGREIGLLVSQGATSLQNALSEVASRGGSGMISASQAVAVLAAIAAPGSYDFAARHDAIVAMIGMLIDNRQLTAAEAMAAIERTAAAGADTYGAVYLLGSLIKSQSADVRDAAIAQVNTMVDHGLLTAPVAMGHLWNAIYGSARDANAQALPFNSAGFALLADIASAQSREMQAAFGQMAYDITRGAPQNGVPSERVVQGVMEGLSNRLLTAQQTTQLLGHMLVAAGPASMAAHMATDIHLALKGMIDSHQIGGGEVIDLLRGVGAQAIILEEIDQLRGNTQTLVASAGHGSAQDLIDAGAELGNRIRNWEVSFVDAMQAIGNASRDLTGVQQVSLLAAVVGSATQFAWAAHGIVSTNAIEWCTAAGNLINSLVQSGRLTANEAMTAIDAAVAAPSLTANQAVILLGGAAHHAALQPAVATEVAVLVGRGQISADNAVAIIANLSVQNIAVPTLPTVLTATDATDVLLLMTAAPGASAALCSAVGHELGRLVPAEVTQRVLHMVDTNVLTGAQAFAVLTPYAANGHAYAQAAAGDAMATLIQSQRLTMADVHAAIASNAIPPDHTPALLAAMTGRGDAAIQGAALAEIRALISAGRLTADQVSAAINGCMNLQAPTLQGALTADQAILMIGAVQSTQQASVQISMYLQYANSIRGGYVSADHAIEVLAGAAIGGSMQRVVEIIGEIAFSNRLTADHVGADVARAAAAHSISADQAVDLIIALQVNPRSAGGYGVGSGIGVMIAQGTISPAEAMADIDRAVTSHAMTADQAMALLAGVSRGVPANNAEYGATQRAIGAEINNLIVSGQITAQQAVNDIAYMAGNTHPSNGINLGASFAFDRALSASQGIMLLVELMAATDNAALDAAAARQVGMLIGQAKLSAADAVAAVHGAVTSGGLTAEQALVVLAQVSAGTQQACRDINTPDYLYYVSLPGFEDPNVLTKAATASAAIGRAVGDEVSALVSANRITAERAVEILTGVARDGSGGQQVAAGAAVAALVAHSQMTPDQAIASMRGAASNWASADHLVTMLAGMFEVRNSALDNTVNAEVEQMIRDHRIAPEQAVTMLALAAGQSTSTVQAAVGAALAALVSDGLATPAQVTGSIDAALRAGVINEEQGRTVLMAAAGHGNASLQIAVGTELIRMQPMFPENAYSAIRQAISYQTLTPAQATLVLVGAGFNSSNHQWPTVGAEITRMVNAHQITGAEATTLIHGAVTSHALTYDQGVQALAYLTERGNPEIRQAAFAELTAMVTAGDITGVRAVEVLASIPTYQSATLQCLTGGIIGRLIEHGDISGAQAIDILTRNVGRPDFDGADCIRFLMGMAANNGSAVDVIAGQGIATLAGSRSGYIGYVMGIINDAVTSNLISGQSAMGFLFGIAAADRTVDGMGVPGVDVCAVQISRMVNENRIPAPIACQLLLEAALQSQAHLGVAGDLMVPLTVRGVANDPHVVDQAVVYSSAMQAIRDGRMTGDQALVLYAHLGVSASAISGLINLGATTADHAVEVMAAEAAHGSPRLQETVGAIIIRLAEANVLTIAQAMADIHALVASHTITGEQAVAVLIGIATADDPFRRARDGAYAVAAGAELAALIDARLVSSDQAKQVFNDALMRSRLHDYQATLTVNEAMVMLMGAAVNGGAPAQTFAYEEIVQQVAWRAITGQGAMDAIHAAIVSQALDVDRTVARLTLLAHTSGPVSLQSDVNAEIVRLVGTRQVTALHVVEVLTDVAGQHTNTVQVLVGNEINALVASKHITANDAVAKIADAAAKPGDPANPAKPLSGSQAVVVLAGVSAATGDGTTQKAVVSQIDKMVSQGTVTADQAASAITGAIRVDGTGGPDLMNAREAATLFSNMASTSMDLRHAAAQGLANMLSGGQLTVHDLWSVMRNAIDNKTMTVDQSLAMLVDVSFRSNPAIQDWTFIQIRHMMFFTREVEPTHGVAVIAGAAASGNTAMQLFVGRELNQLMSPGFLTPAQAMAGLNAALASRSIGADQAIAVLAGMAVATGDFAVTNAVQAEILHLVQRGTISADRVAHEIVEAIGPDGLSVDQAVMVLSDVYNSGHKILQNPVVHEIGTLIANGQLTVDHALENIRSNLTSHHLQPDNVISMLTGLAIDGRFEITDAAANEIATVRLQQWGVPTTAGVYAELAEGLRLATHDFVAMHKGEMTAAQALAGIESHARAHHLPADIFLTQLLGEVDRWTPQDAAGRAFAADASAQIMGHIRSGAVQEDIAHLVVTGVLSMDAAEQMMMLAAATVAPHYDVFLRDIRDAAINVLRVDVRAEIDAALVASGQLSAHDAILHIKDAAGKTGYAIDIGLARLAELTVVAPMPSDALLRQNTDATPAELAALHAEHNARVAAHDAILQELAVRLQMGASAADVLSMVSKGVLTATDAIHLIQDEAKAGRPGENGAWVEAMALARLGESSSVSSSVRHELMNDTQYLQKMLAGASSLMVTDLGHMAQHMEFSRALFRGYVNETADLSNPASVQQKADEAQQWYGAAWWFMRDKNAVADTFGRGISLTNDAANHGGSPDAAARGFVQFGATLAAQGIPGQGLIGGPTVVQAAVINSLFTGATGGAGAAVTSITLEAPTALVEKISEYYVVSGQTTVGISPAMIFTAVNLASKTLPLLFSMDAVASNLGGVSDMVNGTCRMVSGACDVITNSITRGVVSGAMDVYDTVTNMGMAIGDIGALAAGRGSTAALEHHARAMGESMFSMMFAGTDVNAVINAGVNTGEFMVDLFSGHTSDLRESAQRMGESLWNVISSNKLSQIVSSEFQKFGDVIEDTFSQARMIRTAEQFANSRFGSAMADVGQAIFGRSGLGGLF